MKRLVRYGKTLLLVETRMIIQIKEKPTTAYSLGKAIRKSEHDLMIKG